MLARNIERKKSIRCFFKTIDRSELNRLTGGNNTLAVGDILHKAVISVDLSGTEAAAATFVQVQRYAE